MLEAALDLFSRQGYRGTSVREIAAAAGVSTGNVYHHFPDKETMFVALLEQYWEAIDGPDLPLNKALASGQFPDDLAALGEAARETVEKYKPYVALIYVDVVEFGGVHIRRFYSEMARRFEDSMGARVDRARVERRIRPGISPGFAAMLVSRVYLNYFAVEILFGVPNHFGKSTPDVIRAIADILERGIRVPEDPSAGSPATDSKPQAS
ncbi:MAG: TetR/AcrR family transcriptional regulator [Acidobacteriota bacterium]